MPAVVIASPMGDNDKVGASSLSFAGLAATKRSQRKGPWAGPRQFSSASRICSSLRLFRPHPNIWSRCRYNASLTAVLTWKIRKQVLCVW